MARPAGFGSRVLSFLKGERTRLSVMQRVRAKGWVLVLLCGALALAGCRNEDGFCPVPGITLEPEDIPAGDNDTSVTVVVTNPSPDNGRAVLTELSADSGAFEDAAALATRYTCAHDVSGGVEICVDATYGPPGSGSDGGVVAAAVEYLRAPTGYFVSADDCLQTACTTVVCPTDKNLCPDIAELSVTPEVLDEGEVALVRVDARDPDENPAPLVTRLSATAGILGAAQQSESTYQCDPAVGGDIQICVTASDGDDSCDAQQCVTVACPGPPPNNTCPVIRDLSADPSVVPPNERQSVIVVDAVDPDESPESLRTILSASAGTFDDRGASTARFTCGAPGPAEICVRAVDGDRACEQERCTTVQCPSTVEDNLCPKLYVVNAIPSTIPDGRDWTEVQTRAVDFDDGPLQLVTTFYAFRGTFDEPNARNTIYRCERSGLQEVCVDAFDGACVKTLCTDVICPDGL